MSEIYAVAIVGSGPAGLSAAARAAELGLPHVLLEAQGHLADTLARYQRGKHVMAEPGFLELRSPLHFAAGTREAILDSFAREIRALGATIRFKARVVGIGGSRGSFAIALENGETVRAAQIVLAIGMQGNLRTLGVPGEQLPKVQYQLDDPKAHSGETIIVVGAGDAAIENALALAAQDNRVVMINRGEEFSRCKDGNLAAIQAAIGEGVLACRYGSRVDRIEAIEASAEEAAADFTRTMMMSVVDLSRRQPRRSSAPGLRVVLNTPDGEEVIEAHRVIARLGAIPPRKLVEGFGIRFTSADASALPALSPTYESSVPGIYVVGALGGYPLIKQAMNQGYEAIESICGRAVIPADEPLLAARFAPLLGAASKLSSVADVLALVRRRLPWIAELNELQLREFMLESEIRLPDAGEVVFRHNDYSNSFFSIVHGHVLIEAPGQAAGEAVAATIGAGNFFGELGLISGRRRSATVRAAERCILVETPRRAMLRLLASVDSVRREVDRVSLRRAVRKYIAPQISEHDLSALIEGSQIRSYKAGETLFGEGDAPDGLYLIRRGSVTVSRTLGGREVVLSYVAAGNYVGEMALVSDAPRSATIRAAAPTEAIVLLAARVTELLASNTALRAQLDERYLARMQANQQMSANVQSGNLIAFLMQQGAGEATDVLLIDESICIRCDNCERACADTHGGASRLDRAAGPTFDRLHVPTSCRHCEHPHCMKDCPPDAIRRSPRGEVYITEACIGCGNCERNCPYGVIQMAPVAPPGGVRSLWAWLLAGIGNEPGVAPAKAPAKGKKAPFDSIKKAVKCDMCRDIRSGPACVRACPTGAALRVSSESFLEYAASVSRGGEM
jgi:CRP-like cAMP-binding protein/thioredoxin reductase/ferredoxin-like protein FixX